jgi:hypothetical protein
MQDLLNQFIKILQRETIEIVLRTGESLPTWAATLETLLSMLPEWINPPIMGAVVNGELRELTYKVYMDAWSVWSPCLMMTARESIGDPLLLT